MSTCTHNLCFFSKIRKLMYNPVNTSFHKSAVKGGQNYIDMFS